MACGTHMFRPSLPKGGKGNGEVAVVATQSPKLTSLDPSCSSSDARMDASMDGARDLKLTTLRAPKLMPPKLRPPKLMPPTLCPPKLGAPSSCTPGCASCGAVFSHSAARSRGCCAGKHKGHQLGGPRSCTRCTKRTHSVLVHAHTGSRAAQLCNKFQMCAV